MPTVEVYDIAGNKSGSLELMSEVFESPVREDLMQVVVRWQLAAARSGTASTKTRSEVRGGGSKPWRQKHSGRARHGSIRSPIWRKGGVTFGPKPKDWSFNVPRKVRKQALRSALSARLGDGGIKVVQELSLPEIKTRRVADMLSAFGVTGALFIDVPGADWENFAKSANNIPGVKMLSASGVNVYDTLGFESLILTVEAVKSVQEALVH
ncbi:MAG: 50S ribosomal protein L4 [Candidatus Dadabacteria bacterium]|nr:50S ribosomal protein L4 [Candidatus Dadabacteria bacterium]MCY4042663.1 50S ribosomal protein L4 [Candidatus Dadabacteria bacterium]